MEFDDLLKAAWKGETRLPPPAPELPLRLRQRQTCHRMQRTVEVALSLVAAVVFGRALASGRIEPSHWLLMPFYIVFVPVAWVVVLRRPVRPARDAFEQTGTYAGLRMSQLRTGLRDLWLARATAWALLAYAATVNVVVPLLAWHDGRQTALLLLGTAIAWLGATHWLGQRLRGRWLREYRAMRRLSEA